MSKYNYSISEKFALIGRADVMGITVNGNPATLSGAKSKFAVVTDGETNKQYEFDWMIVDRVLKSGGEFST